MDKVGLDVVYDIEMIYHRLSRDDGDRPPAALAEKIKRRELGEKTVRGVYTYPDPEYLKADFLAWFAAFTLLAIFLRPQRGNLYPIVTFALSSL